MGEEGETIYLEIKKEITRENGKKGGSYGEFLNTQLKKPTSN